jgi:methylated-DNA-[protein]-cysteine S-methyltransferase
LNKLFHHYVIFETQAGWIGLLGSDLGLSRTTLPQKSRDLAALSLGQDPGQTNFSPLYFQELIKVFERYFQGFQVEFPANLDFSRAKAFERSVWETTRSIPYGTTRSYGWVARQINKPLAYRAVGAALGKNPWPIIVPCHRVLGSDGSLHGFGGGLGLKQYLLDMESKRSSVT